MVGGEKSLGEEGEARVFISLSLNAKSAKDAVGQDFAFQEQEEKRAAISLGGGRGTPGQVTRTPGAEVYSRLHQKARSVHHQ